MTLRPLFIFSAPRSGSTLLQRVLGAHSQIATASEPWVLLPLLAPLYDRLPAASDRDGLVRVAMEDFLAELPDGDDDYRRGVRELALGLYARAGGEGAAYFIDKTPLYHLIVDEVLATFPDARFIFLFRNPLSLVASTVELFDEGRWDATRYTMALFQSIEDLVPASRRHAGRALTVRFEDLVGDEESKWRGIIDYLGLDWEPQMLEEFSEVELRGRMGDPTGTREYSELSREPIDKWRRVVNNRVRRTWCGRYLRWIGPERLAVMGYDYDALRRDLDAAPVDGGGELVDVGRLVDGLGRELVRNRLPAHSGGPSVWRKLLS